MKSGRFRVVVSFCDMLFLLLVLAPPIGADGLARHRPQTGFARTTSEPALLFSCKARRLVQRARSALSRGRTGEGGCVQGMTGTRHKRLRDEGKVAGRAGARADAAGRE